MATSRSFRLYLTGWIAAAAIFCSPSALFAAQHVPPSIVTQPLSLAVPAGQGVTFSVVASGSPTLAYQWRFNGTDIPGATDTNLVVINASSSNAGPYSVQVTNLYGTTNSSNATLTVNYPPVILVHPVSQAALLGSNVAFQVTATGTPAFGYRWQLNGVGVPGATNATLTISAVQSNNVGAYAAVVTNAGGATTSLVATLSIVTSPDFLWARKVTNGTPPNFAAISHGRHIAADPFGNAFVAGGLEGSSIDFGGATLTNSLPYFDLGPSFLAKYDLWGNFQWAQAAGVYQFGPPPLRVATDSFGNAYLAGRFEGTNSFGTNVLVSCTPADLFVAKYDSQGQLLWVRQVGAYDRSFSLAFAVDADGNAILSSRYTNALTIASISVTNSLAFLAKYDSSGNLLWAQPSLPGDAVAFGSDSSVFLAGAASQASATPGTLARYDPFGNLLWSRPFPHALAIAVDAAMNIYTTGYGVGTNGDITVTNVDGLPDFFLAKCNASGDAVWVKQVGSIYQQWGLGVGLDELGNVYVVSMSANVQKDPLLVFGGTTLTNVLAFMAKYDSAGNALWARALGGTNGARAYGLAVHDSEQIYVTGDFWPPASFGNFNLVDDNPNGEDLYVAKLAGVEPAAPPQITGQPQSHVVAIGASVTFNVIVPSGIPLAYQWFFNATSALPGATNSAFTITNAQLANAGNYSVTVTNAYGLATSERAALTVYPSDGGTLSSPYLFGTNRQVRFTVTGLAGLKYAVQASSNLTDWIFLVTNTSPFLFTDASAGNFARRYYRSIYIP